jgi:hypothetical protein
VVNSAQPSYNQYGGMGGGGKLFSLQLTDGKRDALGIEYRPIAKFSGMDTPPGTKVMMRCSTWILPKLLYSITVQCPRGYAPPLLVSKHDAREGCNHSSSSESPSQLDCN